ncbi:Cysteine and histidine-rich domain-containing protein 1 [Exophiala dermatitidis]
MAQKCVHKGCGKTFTDPDEVCIYHPGPPEFHEGQKGWKCCKPRVLTFDEFLAIPPCTKGKHSTVDDTPVPAPVQPKAFEQPTPVPVPTIKPLQQQHTQQPQQQLKRPPEPPAEESDDPDADADIPPGATCKRRGCGKSRDPNVPRDEEECVYHPGVPIFHEGSKGWTCCKRRVLEFDEFLKIQGCKRRKRHCYIGKKKDDKKGAGMNGVAVNGDGGEGDEGEELLSSVRNDFYQTPTSVIASFYLKKIVKERAKVEFRENGLEIGLDLPTSDHKRFKSTIPLYAPIDPEKSTFKIMGTKLELELAKKDGTSWATLRSDEKATGERIQVGRAGRLM